MGSPPLIFDDAAYSNSRANWVAPQRKAFDARDFVQLLRVDLLTDG
jgi:hypothetical protein